MSISWSLTVEVPEDELVRDKRGGIIRRPLSIPALHNTRDWKRCSAVTRAHKAALDAAQAELLVARNQGWHTRQIRQHLAAGEALDVLLIRRAPRPLDCAVQRDGRGIYGDNLGSSLKPTRDWVAKRVLRLEGDSSPLVRWHCGQERSDRPRQHQIVILIVPALATWWELPDRWLRGEI